MEEVKHTKGPWKCEIDSGEGWKGRYLYVTVSAGATLIAYFDATFSEYPEADEEIAANARLMTAAPELLEALQGLMELESRGRLMPVGSEWNAARAAIAKATSPT